MNQIAQPDHISSKRVVYGLPGMETVAVRRDEPYRAGSDAHALDLYYPPASHAGARLPVVLFVLGFSDVGARKMLGCRFKEMGSFVSWAQLAAASGLVGVTYAGVDPVSDVQAVLDHIRQHASSLDLDAGRIGLWACSGHVPNALSVLMQDRSHAVKCAALCYGYTLDAGESTAVADAAKQWGFVNPCAGRSIADLPRDVPLFVARAGGDQAPLNEALDAFVAAALRSNRPLTCVNHSFGPHAFDVLDDSPASREIVRQILAFLQFQLSE